GSREWGRRRPHVVAAVHDSANLPAARLAGGENANVIAADDVAIRLIVQSHRQSGLSQVYTDLLDFAGHEFYMRREPALAGTTFGDALSAYELGIPSGLRRADGTVLLNPPMDTVIRTDDEVIVLAEDDLLIRLASDPAPPVKEAAIATATPRAPEPERTLMLGWNHRAPKIIELLDAFLAPGSALTVAGRAARGGAGRRRRPRTRPRRDRRLRRHGGPLHQGGGGRPDRRPLQVGPPG